jgi:PKD repeat protein
MGGGTVFRDLLIAGDYETATTTTIAEGYQVNVANGDGVREMFIPTSVTGGADSKYLADYYWYPGSSNANAPNILFAGGGWISAGQAGVGFWGSAYPASFSAANLGARAEFRYSNVTAAFTGTPLTGLLPLTVIFVDNSSGYPTSWYWEFGDGSTSTSQNPTHQYVFPGNYNVNLRVTDEISTDWKNKSSYVIISESGYVNFTATPTDYSCPTNVYNKGVCEVDIAFADTTYGLPNTYFNWSFGDNTWFNTSTVSARNPTHKYSMVGTYSPSLYVTNTTVNASATYGLTKVNYIHIAESPTGGGNVGYSIYNDMPGMLLYISAMIILAIFVSVLMMWYRPKNW